MVGEYNGGYVDAKNRILIVTERWYKWNNGKPYPTQVDILNTITNETVTYPFEKFLGWVNGKSLQKIN